MNTNLPTNVHCPTCRRCIRLNAADYLVSDNGLIVPRGISLHCPSCLTPAVPDTLLPYWQLEQFIHKKGGDDHKLYGPVTK